MPHIAAITLLLAAGCTGSAPVDGERAWAKGALLAGPPLWEDPQNTPHPLFDWPTLSNPPTGELPEFWQSMPARTLPVPITALAHVAQASGVTSSGGMALFGSLAVLPGLGGDSHVVDLSNPAAPRLLSRFNRDQEKAEGADDPEHGLLEDLLGIGSHRGTGLIAYPSGRLVAVFATNTVIDVWDLTDPRRPRALRPLPTAESHKLGVVPGTPIVYNAASGGGGNMPAGSGFTEIFDLTDPERAVLVQNFPNGFSCHHIFFWNNPAQNKYRAICAGVEYTQLWDTADPRNPRVIVSLPVHHGVPGTPSTAVTPVAFSHSAGLNRNGTILYVGDENGGGGLPPGCVASVATPAGDPGTPVGALWFYDVSTETAPLLRGWYSALNDPRVKSAARSCTAHHGRLVPDPAGRDLLAMSFYGAGVILVDFTNPLLPHAIAQFADQSNTWETWYHNGYLVTGDLARGMDVLTFE